MRILILILSFFFFISCDVIYGPPVMEFESIKKRICDKVGMDCPDINRFQDDYSIHLFNLENSYRFAHAHMHENKTLYAVFMYPENKIYIYPNTFELLDKRRHKETFECFIIAHEIGHSYHHLSMNIHKEETMIRQYGLGLEEFAHLFASHTCNFNRKEKQIIRSKWNEISFQNENIVRKILEGGVK